MEGKGISGGAGSTVITQRHLVGTSFSSHFFINVLDSCQEDDFDARQFLPFFFLSFVLFLLYSREAKHKAQRS